MIQYYFLNKKLQQLTPKTITVDIFDTLLLRKWQPEPWRFYQFTKIMIPILKGYGLHATSYYLYTQRQNLTQLLRINNQKVGNDYETTYKEIMLLLITDLARRQKISLSKRQASQIVNKLMTSELKYEKSQLYPNHQLLKVLKNAKIKGVKLYFVSDMYLQSAELKELLRANNITIFTGGISSADTLYGKSSGRAFVELSNIHKQISLTNTLHIGDNRHTDFRIPKQSGLHAYHLYIPFHRFKLEIGKYLYGARLKIILHNARSEQKEQYNQRLESQFSQDLMSTQLEAQYIGWLFAPAIIYYLHTLGTTSTVENKPVVFVTGESKMFLQLYNQLGYTNAKILPTLNRTVLIQAYAAILNKKGVQLHTMIPFVKRVLRRKNTYNALAVLGITTIQSNQSYLIGKRSISRAALNDIDIKSHIKQWNNALHTVLKQWQKVTNTRSNQSIIADIGWNDTVQILLKEILLESNKPNQISGMYLGRTGSNIFHPNIHTESQGVVFNSLSDKHAKYLYQPEVWESFLNQDNLGNLTRNDIITGVTQAIEFFNQSNFTAQDFWAMNQPLLVHALKYPPKRIIAVMANLHFDYGTKDEPICPLINTSATTTQSWKWLLFNRGKFKSFYFHQGWKWGAATYYHFRIPYRIWRFKTKKPSF